MSESFTNDAVATAARFDAAGQQVSGSGSEGETTLSFRYDASNNSYTVEAGGMSRTFTSGSLVQQSPEANVYEVVSGNTTDSLTLTRAGTSGRFNYQYVGAGFWQRTVENSTSFDGNIWGLTYGVETPDADLPRTGSATYAVDLLGALTASGEEGPLALRGEGTLIANFLSGAIDANARFIEFRSDGSRTSNSAFDGSFSGTAQLSASANTFSGTGQVNGRNLYEGGFNGRFYGPSAEEVGAIFSGIDPNGYIAALALIGRQDPDAATPGLADLTEVTTFKTGLLSRFYEDSGSGLVDNGVPAQTTQLNVLTYDPDADSYTFLTSPGYFDYWGKGEFTVGPADRDTSRDSADFDAYATGTAADETLVEIFTGQVDGVQLTYSSFARVLQTTQDGSGNTSSLAYTFVPYGVLTPSDQIPVAGTASYTGRNFGYGRDVSGLLSYELDGETLMTVDFGAFSITGTISAFGNGRNGTADRDFGSFTINASVDSTFNGFSGEIDGNGSNTFTGWFYGPGANEFGALFNIFTGDTYLEGITVGTKD